MAQCDVCQRQKYQAQSPGGLLQPLPIPERVWKDIAMDFITGSSKSQGYEAIMVIMDRLSKYGHFLLIKYPYSAKQWLLFAKEVVRLHGVLKTIVSDRDPTFISHFWVEYFRLQATQLKNGFGITPGNGRPVRSFK